MHKDNNLYLLFALLVILVGVPLTNDYPVVSGPLTRLLLFSCLLLVGMWSLKGSPRVFRFGMAFAIAGIVMNVLAVQFSQQIFMVGSFAALFGFLLIAIASTLRQVVTGAEVSPNRLVGAVCIYLLLGIMWAIAYTLLNHFIPGSFNGAGASHPVGWNAEWLYFSFVTMTTLGYGDVSPITATARFLAYFQAVVGQFYVAMLVAGLVGAYISDRQSAGDSTS